MFDRSCANVTNYPARRLQRIDFLPKVTRNWSAAVIEYENNQFFDEEALYFRLTHGLQKASRDVVFVVGAPLTARHGEAPFGVPGVHEVTEMIRRQFLSDEFSLSAFDKQVRAGGNPYQEAFRFLQGRLGQDAANEVVQQAVLQSYTGEQDAIATQHGSLASEALEALESNLTGWSLSPGVRALGELLAIQQSPFSKLTITSNFDPLIGVAIKSAGGFSWRTALFQDGDFQQSKADGCQILHIHGYWHGTDTLHTSTQLSQKRTTLRNSLLNALEGKLIVVMAYGGWDDVFTSSLESLVGNASDFPEVIWTFYDSLPAVDGRLKRIISPGIDRGRVNLYSGIDCHVFLPRLASFWSNQLGHEAPAQTKIKQPSSTKPQPLRFDTRNLECDRPPSVDVWVGREPELRALETSDSKIAIISGFGGQGKSHLAAKYLEAVTEGETQFSGWDWRDCKEEGDRIRTQIIAAIERVTNEPTPDNQMETMNDRDLVNSFIGVLHKTSLVFVFDNVDHYVDLEKEEFVGILDVLVRQFAKSASQSRIIFTCRPQVNYDLTEVSSFTLLGISLTETVELFKVRCGHDKVDVNDIKIAHELTAGHPIWLDMMAVRVARVPGMTLSKINDDIRRDRSKNPDILSSLWKTLADREQTVLRVMSEAKRAETMDMIEKFVGSQLNYNKFSRAIRSLIALNLVIVKAQKNAPDLYDLHPLVRAFVRKNFNRPERKSFIQIVINEYNVLIKGIEAMLGVHLPFPLLERWSQKAELEIEAGLFEDAFATLNKADDALIGGGHAEEFIRVAGKLFEAVDWLHASSEIKDFDDVVSSTLFCLEQLQRREDSDSMLERYKQTTTTKSARYIKYLDVLAEAYWNRGEFQNAIDTAQEGVTLKEQTGVDTGHDCGHTLALAQRDGGAPEAALTYFLKTHDLDHILTKDGVLTVKEPTAIGNIGRCLQMMGRTEDAIICFRRSAQLLDDNASTHRLSNLTYAYHWLGQALTSVGESDLGYSFFVEAEDLAAKYFPGRLSAISGDKETALAAGTIRAFSRRESRKQVRAWLDS